MTTQAKDTRYELISTMMKDGKVKEFNDIFKFIPKTVVAKDLGKKVDRFTDLMDNVGGFTLEEIFELADLCDLTKAQMYQLMEAAYMTHKKRP